jgi:hypothetical protein
MSEEVLVPTVRVVLTSRLVLEVYNPPPHYATLVNDLRATTEAGIGRVFDTLTGARYSVVRIEQFAVEVQPKVP